MKVVAILLIVLVLAAVGGIGYLYLSANLEISFVECIATDGVTQVDFFNDLSAKVANGSFVGTRFDSKPLQAADQYKFLTYTVRLRNKAFLKAEVIEIRITPMQGDVLQIGEESVHDLAPDWTMDLSATILTAREMHSVREASVSYYFWGIPFTTKMTFR